MQVDHKDFTRSDTNGTPQRGTDVATDLEKE